MTPIHNFSENTPFETAPPRSSIECSTDGVAQSWALQTNQFFVLLNNPDLSAEDKLAYCTLLVETEEFASEIINGMSPLDIVWERIATLPADRRHYSAMAKLLIAKGAKIPWPHPENVVALFHRALGGGNMTLIDLFLSAGFDLNCGAESKMGTPLNHAILRQNLSLVEYFLQKGANPHQKSTPCHGFIPVSPLERSCLAITSQAHSAEIVKLLLTYETTLCQEETTPIDCVLSMAFAQPVLFSFWIDTEMGRGRKLQEKLYRLLAKSNLIQLAYLDADPKDPLDHRRKIAGSLAHQFPRLSEEFCPSTGCNLVHYVVNRGDLHFLDYLAIHCGVNLTLPTDPQHDSVNALHIAIERGQSHLPVIEYLSSSPVGPLLWIQKNVRNHTPFQTALTLGDSELVHRLLSLVPLVTKRWEEFWAHDTPPIPMPLDISAELSQLSATTSSVPAPLDDLKAMKELDEFIEKTFTTLQSKETTIEQKRITLLNEFSRIAVPSYLRPSSVAVGHTIRDFISILAMENTEEALMQEFTSRVEQCRKIGANKDLLKRELADYWEQIAQILQQNQGNCMIR